MKGSSKKEHLFPLDFVRVAAALSIVVFHFNMVSFDYPDIHFFRLAFLFFANGCMGHIGVSLFFILAGASLMYTYQEKLKPAEYFKKRFMAMYPLYWTVYAVFFIYFFIIKHYPINVPRKRILLTVIGMDGYLAYRIPNLYLVGEWFVGCIILIYLIFPLLRAAMLKRPVITAVVTGILYVPLVYWYPLQMSSQYFFLMRVPEVMFGMYFMRYLYGSKEARARYDWKWGLASFLLCVFTFKVPVNAPEPYRLILIGVSCFLFLTWIGQTIRSEKIKRALSIYSKYTYSLFLVHHILLGKFLFPFSGYELKRPGLYVLFAVYLLFISLVAVVLYQFSNVLVSMAAAAIRWGNAVFRGEPCSE